MYTMDLNPERLAIGPISPNFTKTNRNSNGNSLLNETEFEASSAQSFGIWSILNLLQETYDLQA
jgi:hypothetical protein